jgi:ribosomal protein S18 acetylase RimI-like enzyme
MFVRSATPTDLEPCAELLAGLPEYFTADTQSSLRASFPHNAGWVALEHDRIVGFVLVERRYDSSAEITFAAVATQAQRNGIGTALVDAALGSLEKDAVALVEAKTLDASSGYEPYVATRAFWEARGFRQIDCIDPLPGWEGGNPSAIYVAALRSTR